MPLHFYTIAYNLKLTHVICFI